MTSHIQKLIDKARDADKSEDALRFSQAACNIVNAQRTMKEIDSFEPPERA